MSEKLDDISYRKLVIDETLKAQGTDLKKELKQHSKKAIEVTHDLIESI